jgi:hypothetical protein
MYQAGFSAGQGDECAKFCDAGYLSFQNRTDF